MPKVSIVLPVYNGEKYIKKAVDSILNQSFSDFELIIVNDCSTDNTEKILDLCDDDRIVIINNSENQKLPKSLNIGFKKAKGEYLTWTSDDNEYHTDALKSMINILDEKSDVGLVYSDYILIDENDNPINESILPEPDNIIMGNCVGACFLYRKSVADLVGEYDYNLFLAEDYDYWLRIYENSKMYHLSMVLYNYRTHSNSLSKTKINNVINQTSKLWLKHFDFISGKLSSKRERFDFYDRIIDCDENNDYRRIIKKIPLKDKNYVFRAYINTLNRFCNRIINHFRKKIQLISKRKQDGLM